MVSPHSSVHGEYRFSSLPMPTPKDAGKTGGRLNGGAMRDYFETFAARFLDGCIRFEVEVLSVRRGTSGKWEILLRDLKTDTEETVVFDKIVLCTGVCFISNTNDEVYPADDSTRDAAAQMYPNPFLLQQLVKLDSREMSFIHPNFEPMSINSMILANRLKVWW